MCITNVIARKYIKNTEYKINENISPIGLFGICSKQENRHTQSLNILFI